MFACQIAVPVGRLSKEDLQPHLSVHQGIPATASILAFEPVQRVLAVASLYVIPLQTSLLSMMMNSFVSYEGLLVMLV
jgi:syntaxin-binding protein 5